MARISSIAFDKREQPRRDTILTKLGTVMVEWREVSGDRCWFNTGNLPARKLAVPVIQRIERLFS